MGSVPFRKNDGRKNTAVKAALAAHTAGDAFRRDPQGPKRTGTSSKHSRPKRDPEKVAESAERRKDYRCKERPDSSKAAKKPRGSGGGKPREFHLWCT